MKSELIVFIFINLGICSYGQLDLGSLCIVEQTKSSGICKLFETCPSIIDHVKHKDYEYTRCGFAGLKEIVCCPEISTTTTNSSVTNSISRISERKCEEYKSTVFEEVSSLSLGGPHKKLLVDNCVHKAVPIIGINGPRPKEFPHMALIGFGSDNGKIEWLCSGSLISDEYVLTAAHCGNTKQYGPPKYVRLGELNFSNEDDSRPEDFNISTIIIHPEYKVSAFYNDIALIKLNRKAELNSYKRPACLPTTFDNDGIKAISTGWGKDSPFGIFSPLLRKNILEIFPSSECNTTYTQNRKLKQGIISDTQICAGLRHEIKDGDFPDSGVLQIYHPDQYCMYTVIGIASFGFAGSNPSIYPDVFTRVFHYIDWIENNVWKNDS